MELKLITDGISFNGSEAVCKLQAKFTVKQIVNEIRKCKSAIDEDDNRFYMVSEKFLEELTK